MTHFLPPTVPMRARQKSSGSGNGALSLYGSAYSFPLFSSRTIAPDNSQSAQSSRAERKNEPRDNAFQSPTTLPSCRHKIKSLCYFYAQALFFM